MKFQWGEVISILFYIFHTLMRVQSTVTMVILHTHWVNSKCTPLWNNYTKTPLESMYISSFIKQQYTQKWMKLHLELLLSVRPIYFSLWVMAHLHYGVAAEALLANVFFILSVGIFYYKHYLTWLLKFHSLWPLTWLCTVLLPLNKKIWLNFDIFFNNILLALLEQRDF